MANVTIYDIATGELIERAETSAEKKQREADIAETAATQAAAAEAAAKREAVLAALAAAAGLEVDEVKAALGA